MSGNNLIDDSLIGKVNVGDRVCDSLNPRLLGTVLEVVSPRRLIVCWDDYRGISAYNREVWIDHIRPLDIVEQIGRLGSA